LEANTSKPITREEILERLKKVEHPEIAVSLVDLGMILDVAVDKYIAKVAIALPMMNIPFAVRDAIENTISKSLQDMGLEIQADYFEMTPEVRDNFFITARANWKGSI